MTLAWRRVVAARPSGKRLALDLECGHRTSIDPVMPAGEKLAELLASTVPCVRCHERDVGIAEADAESASEAKRERAWNGDEIVRSPRFL